VDEAFQLRFSNLVDAYKKCELVPRSSLALYYLSSIPTDQAEPSEGLRASVVWHYGLPNPSILLSNRQVSQFRLGAEVQPESEVRGQRGAYLVRSTFKLQPQDDLNWAMVADVEKDQTDVVRHLRTCLPKDNLAERVQEDVAAGERNLRKIVAGADGVQLGENLLRTHRHQSNVIYNLMRGGTPVDGYQIPMADFAEHTRICNQTVHARHATLWQNLGGSAVSRMELLEQIEATGDLDLIRIFQEYLPLALSRRHGDPTRPWNAFSIETKNSDGSPRLNYQGNWRDIFQNWEALGCTYPQFLQGMILRFVNASTADGYNPYRLTKSGYEWEELDPEDPWANIGYWGDHQVAYLGKLIEWAYRFYPQDFHKLLDRPLGVYAQIPYRICPYERMLQDPYRTIDYDTRGAHELANQTARVGADGKLLLNRKGEVHRVSLLEKLFLPAIVKLTNLIPEAGIWLNTQRPEWNDANNALVGHGASVVTVCYLRRYLSFLLDLLNSSQRGQCLFTLEIADLIKQVDQVFTSFESCLGAGFTNQARREIVDQLQTVGSKYRQDFYDHAFQGDLVAIDCGRLIQSTQRWIRYLDQTIATNQRPDGLYHSYNLVRFEHRESAAGGNAPHRHKEGVGELRVEHLYEMLEGQVAVLNSQKLSAEAALDVLIALRNSSIYRDDLGTYMLYPDRELPDFCDKNLIAASAADRSELIRSLVEGNHHGIVRRDLNGELRFNGDFRNSRDLANALQKLRVDRPELRDLIEKESKELEVLFQTTFHHHRFTGRSGTFFGYEGLGSVYWHMVSKLLLAVADVYVSASQSKAGAATLADLRSHYREIREGLGTSSLPGKYGAFPIDPYSHTPKHAGAQQPGMTGQVKEDILSRFAELGVRIDAGEISFNLELFETSELLQTPAKFRIDDTTGQPVEIDVPAGGFAFSFCQVPVIYRKEGQSQIRVFMRNQKEPIRRNGSSLTQTESRAILDRNHDIERIEIAF
jgi:hypothetical protein